MTGVKIRPFVRVRVLDRGSWATSCGTLIDPLLPSWPERTPGPRPVSDRLRPQGIPFVLCIDITWQLLLLEMGFGSGQTCWRRLDGWRQAGASTGCTGSCSQS
ncbi:transposase [Streptomyces cyaneofuscatus]